MTIELTPQQQQALDGAHGEVVSVIDPRTRAAYILLPAEAYQGVRDALEEEQVQKAVRRAGMRNAIGRAEEQA